MAALSTEDKIFICKLYFQNDESVHRVQMAWKREKKTKTAPFRNTILNAVKNFEENGSVSKPRQGSKISKSTPENVEKVRKLILERGKSSQRVSIRKGCQEVDLKRSTFHHILKVNLKMKAFKMSVVQPLVELSKEKRANFAELMQELFEEGDIDRKKIWFSDEAHFYLDGYVNRQNF